MVSSWESESVIWSNSFEFLLLSDVGKCTSISSRINQSVQQHFRQVPTVVQIVQYRCWDELAKDALPCDGLQGAFCPMRGLPVVYLNRARPFAQLQNMIVCALNLSKEDSYAIEIIYHGLLVGQAENCNPPTFTLQPSNSIELPHINVAINFAYLEWQHIMQQIPLEAWISELGTSYEARLFDEGFLLGFLSRETGEHTHQWNHPE